VRTARLTLEPLRVEHATEMVAVLADPRLYEFIGGAPPSEDELRAAYARRVAHPGWLNWIVRADANAIGAVQATVTGQVAELAWVIAPAHQGRGLATEAARAVQEHLRAQGITEFQAHIHPDHPASAAVARRLGLEPTDIVQDREVRWVGRSPAPRSP
jgi:RimJ/RimL family protein N-acetyltransferase